MMHTLIVQMANDGLAFNRLTSLFHRRAADFDSFALDRISSRGRLRATLVVDDRHADAARLESHLRNLQYAFSVQRLTPDETLMRQLALVKIQTNTGQRHEFLSLVNKHAAQMVDHTPGSSILQISGSQDQIGDAVDDLSRIASILEMACSGLVALVRCDKQPPAVSESGN